MYLYAVSIGKFRKVIEFKLFLFNMLHSLISKVLEFEIMFIMKSFYKNFTTFHFLE